MLGPISGVYGSQRILNGEPRQPHFGVDVAGPVGTPVKAPADGVVTLAHPDMYFSGATLIMDHGHGLSSTFLHLEKILVQEGQRVKQGEVVALMGKSGRVTGPHLDWRMNWRGERIDPALLPRLPGLGFTGLSTAKPRAAREPLPGLIQANCHLDILQWRPQRQFLGTAAALDLLCGHLAARRGGTAEIPEPSGLLTHHLVHDAAAWDFLAGLLARLAAHPAVHFLSVRAVFAALPGGERREARP